MRATVVRISGPQRQVFRELVLDRLSGIGDIAYAMAKGDLAEAKRLAGQFGEDLRLMEDLGWEGEGLREADLTMAPEALAGALRRLLSDAEAGLAESKDEREAREVDQQARNRYQYARETCKGLLALVEREAGEGNGKGA